MIKYSLIIGINNYKDESIPPLSFAENDATEIAKFFLKDIELPRYDLEFDSVFKIETHTVLLGPNATLSNIIESIRRIATNCKEDDSVLIYYSGHGASTLYKKNLIKIKDPARSSLSTTTTSKLRLKNKFVRTTTFISNIKLYVGLRLHLA